MSRCNMVIPPRVAARSFAAFASRSLKQISELDGRDRHNAIGGRGPQEAAALEPFGEHACALTIMPDDANQIALATPEHEQMSAMGITLEHLLDHQGQRVEPLSHVRVAGRQPHPRPARNRDHRSTTSSRRPNANGAISERTIMRRPLRSTISTGLATPPSGGSGGTRPSPACAPSSSTRTG